MIKQHTSLIFIRLYISRYFQIIPNLMVVDLTIVLFGQAIDTMIVADRYAYFGLDQVLHFSFIFCQLLSAKYRWYTTGKSNIATIEHFLYGIKEA